METAVTKNFGYAPGIESVATLGGGLQLVFTESCAGTVFLKSAGTKSD